MNLLKMLITLSLFFFLSQTLVFGTSKYRCGSSLVSIGDEIYEVISKCGQPDFSEETAVDKRGSVSGGSVALTSKKVEKLFYCEEGKFMGILTFRGGKLVSISKGDRCK